MHGFLGPNGAGKSTTIRVLLGLLRADAGAVRLLGGDPWRDAVTLHRRLAYVPGDVTLWPNLSGGEVIDLLGRMRGGLDPSAAAELLERFELDPRKKGRAYSKGNRQKVGLVAALASDVELLILDEPTSGLDPLMEEVFQQCVARGQARRPHRAAVQPHPRRGGGALRPGDDHPQRPRRRERHPRPSCATCTAPSIDAELAGPLDGLAGLPGVHDLRVDGDRVRFDVDTAALDAALRRLTEIGVRSLVSQPPTLEELFLRHYGTPDAAPRRRALGRPVRRSEARSDAR